MHKYGYPRKLLVGTSIVALMLAIACGALDDQSVTAEPVPIVLSVQEVLKAPGQYEGERVIVEGQLSLEGRSGRYVVGPNSRLGGGSENIESVLLYFPQINPDPIRMARCVGESIVATGYFEKKHILSVQYVKLLADALTFSPNSCY